MWYWYHRAHMTENTHLLHLLICTWLTRFHSKRSAGGGEDTVFSPRIGQMQFYAKGTHCLDEGTLPCPPSHWISLRCLFSVGMMLLPWLVRLSGPSTSLWMERLPVWFPVRERAWVVGQVPSLGCTRGSQSMFLSLPFPFFKNKQRKSFLKKMLLLTEITLLYMVKGDYR